MSDLSDFIRRVYGPEVDALQARLRTTKAQLPERNKRIEELERQNADLRLDLESRDQDIQDLRAALARFAVLESP